MASEKAIKRIVFCQGVSKFVTALAAVKYRQSLKERLDCKYEDYLVIHDLAYFSEEQNAKTSVFIKQMAEAASEWKSICIIDDRLRKTLHNRKSFNNPKERIKELYNRIGTQTADEIYLFKNSGLTNRLMMTAYLPALKIYSGDGFGLYNAPHCMGTKTYWRMLSYEVQNNTGLKKPYACTVAILKISIDFLTELRLRIRWAFDNMIYFKKKDFDMAYLQMLGVPESKPPIETMITPPSFTISVLRDLEKLLNKDYIADIKTHMAARPVVILLLAAFAETSELTEQEEISAYKEFITSCNLSKDSVLVIKSHPGGNPEKMKMLMSILQKNFHDIILLNENNINFMPFEVIFMNMFLDKNFKPAGNVKVIAFNTAGLPLTALFGISPTIGFGEEMIKKIFTNRLYRRFRLKHEANIKNSLKKIFDGKFQKP